MTIAHLALLIALIALLAMLWLWIDATRHKRGVREELEAMQGALAEAEANAARAVQKGLESVESRVKIATTKRR